MSTHLFYHYRAVLLYEEEGYEAAIPALTDHLAANPSNAAAYNNRAIAFWESGSTTGRSRTLRRPSGSLQTKPARPSIGA